jgi:hypothetical protein
MKKRVGVIGIGSAGIVSLSHLCAWLDSSWEVFSIHDPNINIIGVGESSNPGFVTTIEYGLGFTFEESLDLLDGTRKFGTKFIDWREKDYHFPLIEGTQAIHFNTHKLAEYAIPKLKENWGDKFKILNGTVSDLTQTDDSVIVTIDESKYSFDYIMDCRGFPENFDDYTFSDCTLINHGIVYQTDFNPLQYTEHHATEHGWMFGVPLTTRMNYGYLYNDNITTKEEAIAGLAKKLKIPKSKIKKVNEFAFKSFYANKIMEGRICKNGNRASFFEPISATGIYIYDRIVRAFYDLIKEDKFTVTDLNQTVRNDIEDLETFIRFHYHGGSTIDSEFWRQAKERSIHQLKGDFKFHRLYHELRDLYQYGSRFNHNGLIHNAQSWHKLDRFFGYNYFNCKNNFDFDEERVKLHEQQINNKIQYEVSVEREKIVSKAVLATQKQFKENGYALIKDVVNPQIARLVCAYAKIDSIENFSPEGEKGQIPGTHSKYADPVMETLLEQFLPIMENASGLKLYPTYSYYRLYRPGDTLAIHKDRPSCEISTTVCFGWNIEGNPSATGWPIFMEGSEIAMDVGDIVIYRGCDLAHWRDAFNAPEGSWHLQGFFHYVDANGPYAEFKLDKRPRIGWKLPGRNNNSITGTTVNTVEELSNQPKKYITYLK